mmetsp:Transcript_17319/g.12383  ORF Transcript_17319/g.12383 Transcript_17319/m.12383 type:complete len:96 (-) Transcript_17319:36-323(-)
MCDSYIGLDQHYIIDLIQVNGLILGKQKPKEQEETYQEIKSQALDDIMSDDEKEMSKQIRQGINNLLDSDEDMKLEGEEKEDDNQMIEKDIDNWF